MKALFVGLGSIGKKHIKNLKTLLPDTEIHALRSHGGDLPEDVRSLVAKSFEISPPEGERYDMCFVTNVTNMHYDAIMRTRDFVDNFFIEKPLFSFYPQPAFEMPFYESQKVYIAAPLRHTAVFKILCDVMKDRDPLAVRAICSSYLPTWRPGSDYKKCYSANRHMGGGVQLDLIHEWDYLTELFGKSQRVSSFAGNVSSLGIDSDDCAVYVGISTKNGKSVFISLHLDYFGRQSKRCCEIICEQGTVTADFIGGYVETESEKIDCTEQPNDKLYNEMSYFLDLIAGKAENQNPPERAIEVMRVAMGNEYRR